MHYRINAILLGFYNDLANLSYRCSNTSNQTDEYDCWLTNSKLRPSILVINLTNIILLKYVPNIVQYHSVMV